MAEIVKILSGIAKVIAWWINRPYTIFVVDHHFLHLPVKLPWKKNTHGKW